jgi:hypothetical protein
MPDETRQTLTAIQQEQARQGAEQRHQTEFARETLAKTNLILQRLVVRAAALAPRHARGLHARRGGAGRAPAVDGDGSPYRGLAAFQAEDAEWFFGREQLVAELTMRLAETPFLAVVGASGSGKSSVLRAGLLPAVWSGTLPGASSWTTILLAPGARPLEELAVRVALAEASPDARLLLLVDQFVRRRRRHAGHQQPGRQPDLLGPAAHLLGGQGVRAGRPQPDQGRVAPVRRRGLPAHLPAVAGGMSRRYSGVT